MTTNDRIAFIKAAAAVEPLPPPPDIDPSKYDDQSDEDRAVGESHEADLDLRYEAGES